MIEILVSLIAAFSAISVAGIGYLQVKTNKHVKSISDSVNNVHRKGEGAVGLYDMVSGQNLVILDLKQDMDDFKKRLKVLDSVYENTQIMEIRLREQERQSSEFHMRWDHLPPDLKDADKLADRLNRMNIKIDDLAKKSDELSSIVLRQSDSINEHVIWEMKKYDSLRYKENE